MLGGEWGHRLHRGWSVEVELGLGPQCTGPTACRVAANSDSLAHTPGNFSTFFTRGGCPADSMPLHPVACCCRFWDCCGAADESVPGCVQGFHVSFDDDLNEANGWKE